MVRKFAVKVNGREYIVEVEEIGSSFVQQPTQVVQMPQQSSQTVQQSAAVSSSISGAKSETVQQQKTATNLQPEETTASAPASADSIKIIAPMSGVILKVLVNTGQKVEYGQKVLILEAMKMENDIVADKPGIVKSIKVKEGDTVDTGQLLIELE
ncbi:MAG TPA: biotin/lipoyl-binding protein [Fervidobacterium sp.]|nr:acetyl-CoA carboxylase biotin carboxyl carrier protein subunit [Fervidobacterium sp.]HOK88185.1 biotin/lipoyl-binding protein [Fervidobacterium sp.]HOM74625.1 biotin/lipoyl-binding protein [Fervidobacterium sp.]HOQ39268.1 biotin/lipoyl-binding protein [Fervidobacterium sp.]HPT53841.1 biotin/lipoyl-binding protein [Fervidobacterium sp.]